MSTNNKIFVDSSILIEALKGNKVSFYKMLITNMQNENFINDTVISEYLDFVLGFNSGVSPRTLQEKRQIGEILTVNSKLADILSDFSFLGSDASLLRLAPHFMSAYNLLPNDAIILATCKIHNINMLASHDSDFIRPCEAGGIQLLTEE